MAKQLQTKDEPDYKAEPSASEKTSICKSPVKALVTQIEKHTDTQYGRSFSTKSTLNGERQAIQPPSSYFTLTVDVPDSGPAMAMEDPSPELAYLDTSSMQMKFTPTFVTDGNPMSNLSIEWIATAAGGGFFLSNYVTPTALATLTDAHGTELWYNVTLTTADRSNEGQFFKEKPNSDGTKYRIYVPITDRNGDKQKYFLVAITSVNGQENNSSRQIVATLRENLIDRNPNVWTKGGIM